MQHTARIEGRKIRNARLAAGMTQAQLARAVKTTERNIVRWENSQNQPRVESAVAIARATGCDFSDLLSSDDDEEGSDPLTRAAQGLVSALTAEIRRASEQQGATK